MKTLIVLTVLTVTVALYVVLLRPWLRQRPWAAGFFAAIEPFEIALYRKSETLLRARFKMLAGAIGMALSYFDRIDWAPLVALMPAKYQLHAQAFVTLMPLIGTFAGMLITLSGATDEALRRDTTKSLERVEIPEAVKAEPVVAMAEARADAAQAISVDAAKEAEKKV